MELMVNGMEQLHPVVNTVSGPMSVHVLNYLAADFRGTHSINNSCFELSCS